jgi:hypothetical protein
MLVKNGKAKMNKLQSYSIRRVKDLAQNASLLSYEMKVSKLANTENNFVKLHDCISEIETICRSILDSNEK